jgi:hypothetical protein
MKYWIRRNLGRLQFFAHWWNVFATFVTLVTLSLCFAIVIVWVASDTGDTPVFERKGPPVLHTPRVPLGGEFVYTVHTRQNERCPGEIVTIFTLKAREGVPPAVVTMRRPVTRPDVGHFRDFTARLELPESLGPGFWSVLVAADSKCPLRQVTSVIAQFDSVEVHR